MAKSTTTVSRIFATWLFLDQEIVGKQIGNFWEKLLLGWRMIRRISSTRVPENRVSNSKFQYCYPNFIRLNTTENENNEIKGKIRGNHFCLKIFSLYSYFLLSCWKNIFCSSTNRSSERQIIYITLIYFC